MTCGSQLSVHHSRSALWALALGGALLVGSCDPAPAVDAVAFANALLDATTACEDPFLRQAEPVFFEAQLAAQKEVLEARFAKNRANPHVTFSESAYATCFAAAEGGDCATLSDDAGPCAQVFIGTLASGDTCAESVECGGDTSCFQAPDACGDCRPAAGLGASCAEANCDEGLYCTVALVCEPEPSPATFADGDPCNTTVGCGGITTGLSCVDGLCTPIIVVGRGAPCALGVRSTEYCQDSATKNTCMQNADGSSTCIARPGLSEPCNTYGACDSTQSACVDGVCAAEGQLYDSCTGPYGCQVGGTCEPADPDGTERVCTPYADTPEAPTCAAG